MSNGQPPVGSRAPYVIICSGRIETQAVNGVENKVVAASTCAARFAAFMQSNTDADLAPLAAIQHDLMVHLKDLNHNEAERKIKSLFDSMRAIEQAEMGEYEHPE